MKNGIYHLDDQDYFAEPRLNSSGIKQLLKSPAHYKASLTTEREETKALVIGSAVHCAVLEPYHISHRYIVAPSGIDKRTKAGKEQWEYMQATGKIVLSSDDFDQINSVATSVIKHPTAFKLVKGGQAEMTVFTDIDDVPAKAKMDYYHDNGVIVDLKTTEDASPAGFARSIANYGYDIQAAWYLDCAQAEGLEAHTFVFVAVEKSAPYAVGIYELDAASLEVGRSKYQRALAIWKHCTATDEWPGYDESIITLNLPAWAMREQL